MMKIGKINKVNLNRKMTKNGKMIIRCKENRLCNKIKNKNKQNK